MKMNCVVLTPVEQVGCRPAFFERKDVCRFQVPMDDAAAMRLIQRIRDLRPFFSTCSSGKDPFSSRFANVSPSTHSITK